MSSCVGGGVKYCLSSTCSYSVSFSLQCTKCFKPYVTLWYQVSNFVSLALWYKKLFHYLMIQKFQTLRHSACDIQKSFEPWWYKKFLILGIYIKIFITLWYKKFQTLRHSVVQKVSNLAALCDTKSFKSSLHHLVIQKLLNLESLSDTNSLEPCIHSWNLAWYIVLNLAYIVWNLAWW